MFLFIKWSTIKVREHHNDLMCCFCSLFRYVATAAADVSRGAPGGRGRGEDLREHLLAEEEARTCASSCWLRLILGSPGRAPAGRGGGEATNLGGHLLLVEAEPMSTWVRRWWSRQSRRAHGRGDRGRGRSHG
jgi:hypothetical protein